ncbi:MAG: PD-(D/E)XK nuclease family protein [Bacteroidetes bacterium]|nr:PD-(D/E)XK nuclease family protein [Bacteroidota bacterium]
MEKFLAKTAKYILSKHGNNLSGVTVLMPNHRSCVYFRQALKDASGETIWAPDITTLQDWVYDKSELALIESLEQTTELFEVYRAKGGEETLDEFIPTAQVMLSDFNEVDLQLAEAKPFFNYLEKLQSLKVYEPATELSEYSLRYKKFWHTFRELYFALRERLLEQKKGYSGMIYRDVADKMESMSIGMEERIYLVGFSGMNKSDEKIIKVLLDKGIAEIIWDSDKYYVDDEFQEAGSFFRKYKKQFRIDDSGWKNNLIASAPKNIHIVGVAKNIGQTKVTADILVNKLKLNEETEKETAVIVLDNKLLNPLLSAIPENISALNISMGFPLQESSIAELLKSIFSLHENIERFKASGRQLRYYYRDIFDLLHHPYVSYLIPDKKAVSIFVQRIREFNRMVVSHKELADVFKDSEFERVFWFTENSQEYLVKLLELVDSLRIHFLKATRSQKRDLSVDVELLFHINNTLKNLQNILQENKSELNTKSLRKLLMENIRSVRVPFDGEPIRGLQIMGMQETRCLDFKNIIILSMNEGIFPSGKKQHTYIPYEMRREFLTTHQEADAVSAYLFYRLLQRAENVYLLYNTESDEMGGGEKSRFLLQLQHELKEANPKAIINDLVYSVDPPPHIPDDKISIVKDEVLLKSLLSNLSSRGISPSAINTYINCSLQYYLRYIAGLREQDEIEESIEAATLGSAVHDVLEKLYQDVLGKELSVDFVKNIASQKEIIDQLLRQSFAERFDDESLKRGKNYLLYRVCLKLIREFLKQEQSNLQMLDDSGSSMKLLLLESDMEQVLTVSGHQVKVKGKVDRVEESSGIVSVADYKTGGQKGISITSDNFPLLATDPKYAKGVQLMTYAWLYWKSKGSPDVRLRSGIYWLRNSPGGFDSWKIDKNDILNREILGSFEELLQSVLSELLNPEIPFTKTPDIKRCEYCEFARICRRD